MKYLVDRTPTVIMATAIIHNMAKILGDDVNELQQLQDEEEIFTIPQAQELSPLQVRAAGQARRRLISPNL